MCFLTVVRFRKKKKIKALVTRNKIYHFICCKNFTDFFKEVRYINSDIQLKIINYREQLIFALCDKSLGLNFINVLRTAFAPTVLRQ
jgi:hypothetical protein